MEDKKLEILERASAVFIRYGIKSVTMDDLARELGMSKKTIYKYFSDKNQLVVSIIEMKLEMDQALCLNNQSQSQNAIDDIISMSTLILEQLNNVNPTVFFDIKKYHSEASKLLHDHKWNFLLSIITANIERGKAEGFYKKDLETDIISRLYMSNMEVILNGTIFPWPEFQIQDLIKTKIKFHLYGLVNDKGREYLKTKLN